MSYSRQLVFTETPEQGGNDSQINAGVKARPPGDASFPAGKRSGSVRDARLREEEQHQTRLFTHNQPAKITPKPKDGCRSHGQKPEG